MAQVKIYGIREHLKPIQAQLSDAIHSCVVEALQFPANKRAHRFFHLEAEDLYFPASASARYTIIEISMFEGRSVATKKQLIRLLFERLCAQTPRLPHEIEVTITETPKHNWGFRGSPGDELALGYRVEI
jgi:phenylpyruvate tautomerase PptA (4-oxalocrotonate tautomerase family)